MNKNTTIFKQFKAYYQVISQSYWKKNYNEYHDNLPLTKSIYRLSSTVMTTLLRFFAYIVSFHIPHTLKEIDRKGKIVSLFGHNPTRMAFEDLIKWFLKNNFNFITTENLIEILNKQKKVKRPVWVSVDDGWRANFTNILPILEKYKIPATFFVSTRPIEMGTFWPTEAERNAKQLKGNYTTSLLRSPNTERKEHLRQTNEKVKKREALSIAELQSLAKCKYVAIGNHTDDHVNCLNCSKHELIGEIEIANNKIKNWTGISVKYFAYPGGYRDKNTIQLIKQLGFKIAASTEGRLGLLEDDIYNFPRSCIKNNPVSRIENIVIALGIREKYVIFLRNIYRKILRY